MNPKRSGVWLAPHQPHLRFRASYGPVTCLAAAATKLFESVPTGVSRRRVSRPIQSCKSGLWNHHPAPACPPLLTSGGAAKMDNFASILLSFPPLGGSMTLDDASYHVAAKAHAAAVAKLETVGANGLASFADQLFEVKPLSLSLSLCFLPSALVFSALPSS